MQSVGPGCRVKNLFSRFQPFLSVFDLQEEKQHQKLAFEKHREEKQKEHTQLLLMNNSRKEHILNSVRLVSNMVADGYGTRCIGKLTSF